MTVIKAPGWARAFPRRAAARITVDSDGPLQRRRSTNTGLRQRPGLGRRSENLRNMPIICRKIYRKCKKSEQKIICLLHIISFFAYYYVQNMENMHAEVFFCRFFAYLSHAVAYYFTYYACWNSILEHIIIQILYILHIAIWKICIIYTFTYFFAYFLGTLKQIHAE